MDKGKGVLFNLSSPPTAPTPASNSALTSSGLSRAGEVSFHFLKATLKGTGGEGGREVSATWRRPRPGL